MHHFDSSITSSPELYSVLHEFELGFAATTTNFYAMQHIDSSPPTTTDFNSNLHEFQHHSATAATNLYSVRNNHDHDYHGHNYRLPNHDNNYHHQLLARLH